MVVETGQEILEKDNRYLRLRNNQGRSVSVVREVYRREDIPCQSSLCLGECNLHIGKTFLICIVNSTMRVFLFIFHVYCQTLCTVN